MASNPNLRRMPARLWSSVETTDGGPARLPLLALCLLLTVFSGLLAATQLAKLRGTKAAPHTAFLTRALGTPQSSASLVRKPSRTQRVTLGRDGFTYAHGTDAVSLASLDAGSAAWRRYANGVARSTPFGAETIAVSSPRTEEYLTVATHQGEKTWRWRLDTTLDPTLSPDGTIDLGRGLHVAPVRILDSRGRDVTPKHLRWTIDGPTLSLKLDDGHLPLPYVIDPSVSFRQFSALVSTTNSTSISLTKPSGTVSGDVMIAFVSTRNNYAVNASGWTAIAQTP